MVLQEITELLRRAAVLPVRGLWAALFVNIAVAGGGSSPVHPVKFSHLFHLKEVGAECTDCHGMAQESRKAEDRNMPGHDQCAACHDLESEESCKVCHENLELLEKIKARPPDLFFSHKFHLADKTLSCTTCHQGLEKVAYATRDNFPAMSVCSNCHDGDKAPMACATCHVKTDNLEPENHRGDWLTEHRSGASVSDESCRQCHRSSQCDECHQGYRLIKDYVDPFLIRSSDFPSMEKRKGLVKQLVHGLNYIFLHPIDARGRKQDCTVCHEKSEFCIQCHMPDGSLATKPFWHGNLTGDWGAIPGAVGSGGGRHAEMARRDIELCADCHDVQGYDPVCLACHQDKTPGLGNDPHTHDRAWIDRYGEGEWHDNESSICYNCHVNSNQRGVGFCGYCHD